MNSQTSDGIIEQLAFLLKDVETRAGETFSGVGVIITNNPYEIPIFPLRFTSTVSVKEPSVVTLSRISNLQDEHHDGFHVLAPDFSILLMSQYFSPPIKQGVVVDRSKRFGGRYLAALFGSSISEVIATGIASREFGIAIFQQGQEYLHWPNKHK